MFIFYMFIRCFFLVLVCFFRGLKFSEGVIVIEEWGISRGVWGCGSLGEVLILFR